MPKSFLDFADGTLSADERLAGLLALNHGVLTILSRLFTQVGSYTALLEDHELEILRLKAKRKVLCGHPSAHSINCFVGLFEACLCSTPHKRNVVRCSAHPQRTHACMQEVTLNICFLGVF